MKIEVENGVVRIGYEKVGAVLGVRVFTKT